MSGVAPPSAFTLPAVAAFLAAGGGPEALAHEALARVDAWNDPALFIARVPEADVMAHAAALAAEGPRGRPLYGVPFVAKDNIDVAGLPTTAACPGYAYRPVEDAPCVARLLAADAVLIGKTNLDQFATGLVGVRSPHGAPRNAVVPGRVPGGSSSGSATAVAAGIAAFALGTDTAGSGRVPAACNNIVGLKPSLGLVPTTAALAGAVAAPGERWTAAAPRLVGEPRSPINPDPNACRFHGRCPIGQDVCRTTPPPSRPMPGGRRVACHFPAGAAA